MKKTPSDARPTSLRRLGGSDPARKLATVVLEVLGGVLTPMMAATCAGITLQRYYALEARGLAGMIAALEPRPRGRHRRPEEQLARLTRERDRLTREVGRLTALVRSAHRCAGMAEHRIVVKGKRRRRAAPRAVRAVKLLRETPASGETPPTTKSEETP